MKALFIQLFLITTLLSLVGCGSKENSVSLKVSSSFAMTNAGYTGGLVVSGKNAIGQRFVKTVFGGTSLDIVLPDGAWDISVVGWDGSAPTAGQAPFDGVPYCGKASINLASNDASVSVKVNSANCLTSDFSGGAFVDTTPAQPVIHPLKIVTCGSFYKHNIFPATKITAANAAGISSDFCSNVADHPLELKSRTKSIKLIPIDKSFNGAYSGQPANNPFCLTESDGIFHLPQMIPVSGLPIQIALYEDSACQKQSTFLLFPDGLKDGYAPKFDSIFAHKGSDTNPVPSKANRLIISDNGLNRGWSPFYNQMPQMKCSTGFCGDFVALTSGPKYSDAIFDFFMEVDYQGTVNEPQPINFPASSDICTAVVAGHPGSVSGVPNSLDITGCSFSTSNDKGQITLMVKPQTGGTCSIEQNGICRSPTQKFMLLVNGEYKEIYFNGKKDYGTNQPVQFGHLYVPVRQATVSSSCGIYNFLNITATSNNVLEPIIVCTPTSPPMLVAKPYYNPTNKSFQVDDSGTYYGQISFDDATTSEFKNLVMLPPDAREQRNLMSVIFESIGGTGFLESFKYDNNNNNGGDDDQSRAYGSIKRAREMFSPDGPGGVFGDANPDVCSSTVGTKQIRHTDKDGTHDYEITVANIDGNTSTDAKHVRPLAYCDDVNLVPGGCVVDAPSNYGRYEKSMLVKKDGVPNEIALFDCGVIGNPGVPTQSGRIESISNEYQEGKYRREKELIYWNTYNQLYARFEIYSRQMESASSNYAVKSRDERRYEKVFKYQAAQDKIHGRVFRYSTNLDSSTSNISQNLTAARFQLYRPSSTWEYSYAFFDFHVPQTTDLFAASGEYLALKQDIFMNNHFCGTNFRFPLPYTYAQNCSTTNFISTEPAPVHGTFNNYEDIKGTAFDPLMNAGYFPISW